MEASLPSWNSSGVVGISHTVTGRHLLRDLGQSTCCFALFLGFLSRAFGLLGMIAALASFLLSVEISCRKSGWAVVH